MIFVKPFFDNIISRTHIMFLLSISISILVFVSIYYFFCKILVVLKVVI